MKRLPMSPSVFAILRALVEERTGLQTRHDAGEAFADRVSVRAVELGFDSLLDYYYYLRYDAQADAEMGQLADELVVGETYFFREADQLTALLDGCVVPWARAGARPRIWSAACATGEEPYTLAMMLAERGLLGAVELLASDISARALARARGGGPYGDRSLRALPAAAASWLEVRDGKRFVKPEIAAAVRWAQVNLMDGAQVAALGEFDAILCRNVLIYFGDDTVRRVVGALGRTLRPQGYLLVGVSESLLRVGTALVCEERGGAFLYRKVADGKAADPHPGR